MNPTTENMRDLILSGDPQFLEMMDTLCKNLYLRGCMAAIQELNEKYRELENTVDDLRQHIMTHSQEN